MVVDSSSPAPPRRPQLFFVQRSSPPPPARRQSSATFFVVSFDSHIEPFVFCFCQYFPAPLHWPAGGLIVAEVGRPKAVSSFQSLVVPGLGSTKHSSSTPWFLWLFLSEVDFGLARTQPTSLSSLSQRKAAHAPLPTLQPLHCCTFPIQYTSLTASVSPPSASSSL